MNQLIWKGWQCPICKRVYSPTTTMCEFCGGGYSVSSTETVTNDPEQMANKYKKLIDDVIKSEKGYYDLYLLNMNAIFDGLKKEERGDTEGTADGSGQEGGDEDDEEESEDADD